MNPPSAFMAARRRAAAAKNRSATGVAPANGRSGMYDRKFGEILRRAAAVFRERGYHQASMRDLAQATGVSLAGLYYYFTSKEHLLYLIQKQAFETILESARSALAGISSPEERLRLFVRLHLRFFIDRPNEMKVLTHEEEWLKDEWRRDVRATKKAYYQLCYEQVEALRRSRRLVGLNTRVAVLALFGMMNWIYTWYNPRVDGDGEALAAQMTEIFLSGVNRAWARTQRSEQGTMARDRGANGRRSAPLRRFDGGAAESLEAGTPRDSAGHRPGRQDS